MCGANCADTLLTHYQDQTGFRRMPSIHHFHSRYSCLLSRWLAPLTQRMRPVRPSILALCAALTLCLTLALTACGAALPHSDAQQPIVAHHTLTLVVMGASDAYGIGTYDPQRGNWPTLLAQSLPQPTHLVNLGIPGATLAQAQQEELPVAASQQPNIVVIWLAVNDIIANVPLATYTAELRATLTTLHQQSPHTQVFVGNVPDLTQIPYFFAYDPDTLHAEVNAWNAAIAQACADDHATLADIYSGWGQIGYHPGFISSDGLHPSEVGAEALAAYFDTLITQTLHLDGSTG